MPTGPVFTSTDETLAMTSIPRRQIALAVPALILLAHQRAYAVSINDFSQKQLSSGIGAALQQGAQAALALLGQPGGFLDNPKVKIPLPGFLEKGARALKFAGLGGTLDELVVGMNRAAESAVPLGKDLLLKAANTMTVDDARGILTGGETSVTDFFASRTRSPLSTAFLPVVNKTVGQTGAAQTYNQITGKASSFGLMKADDANLDQYVTGKTLDGLYTVIGDEEKRFAPIR